MKTSIIRKVLVALTLMICHQAYAHDFEVNGIYYGISLFNKNTAYVTHKGKDYAQSYAYSGSINIPDKVTYKGKTYTVATIGGYAFWNCADLKSVTLPNTITDIHQHAFEGCYGLETITIPASVNKIHDQAFFNCKKLNLIELKHTTPPTLGNGVFEGVNYNQARLKVPFSSYFNYKENGNWNMFGLANYEVNGVYYLPTGINSVWVSNRNVYLENVGYYNSYKGNVTIPSEVDIEGHRCNVSEIGESAFRESTELTSVNIANSITYIGESAFVDCVSLANVTIGTGVTTISTSAFHGCTNLTNIEIPDNVLSIGGFSFCGCTKLKSITLGKKVSTITSYAFHGCTGLTDVTSLNTTPPYCGDNAFYDVVVSNVTLTVPSESLSLYKSTAPWKNFKFEQTEEPSEPSQPEQPTEPELPVDTSGLSYNIISETEVEVIAGTEKYIGDIVIPSQTTIEGKVYNVTQIGEKAFYYCDGLKGITIPNSVTCIADLAFLKCSGLSSVSLPNSVECIGGGAFSGCTGLTSVTIGNSVTSIGSSAFLGCSGLTSVNIGNSVTSIGNYAFSDCTGLTGITIPNSVTSIGSSAFSGCSGLTSVTIGNSVTSIGNYAFRGCYGLTSVNISDLEAWCKIDFSSDDSNPFFYAKNLYLNGELLTNIEIPNTITEIKQYALSRCSGLISITIPNSVTSIGYEAFLGCSGLTSVTIGNSVTSIGSSAFGYCSSLTSVISLNPTPPTCGENVFSNVNVSNVTLMVPSESVSLYQSANTWKDFGTIKGIEDAEPELPVDTSGLSYNIISETKVAVIAGGKKHTGDIVIPSQTTIDGRAYIVTGIGNYAFSGCSGMTSITIPNSVTSIGNSAFSGCSGLTSVTIPNSVTSIGISAFSSCTGLESIIVESGNTIYDSRDNCNAIIATSTNTLVTGCKNTTIPEGVSSIWDYAFSGCSGMTSITISNSVTSIGDDAFNGCSGLTSVNISDLEAWCKIDFSTAYSNPLYYADNLYLNGELLTNIEIPNSITEFKQFAFAYCSSLTSVTIPNSVTSIGNYAFQGCSGLTSVTIGNSVTSIGEQAFCICNSLTSVTIGSSVTSIGNTAFGGCTGLTSVTSLNPTPPTCGTNVFYNVSVGNITLEVPSESVSLYQSADIWKNFGTIKGIGDEPELPTDNSGLSYNIISETEVEVIAATEKYTGDIVIPSQTTIDGKVYSVTGIGNNAFKDCTNLTCITIPNSVTSIGNSAFSHCSGLTSVTIPNSVTSIGNAAFSGCSGLTSVTIGNGVTSIGNSAFYNCSSLTSITIGNGVTSIGDDAFEYCSSLTSIIIPNSVTSIGSNPFAYCRNLKSILVESGNAIYDSRNNCNAIIKTSTNALITGCKNTLILNSVTRIYTSAFRGCSGLTSVTIPNSVASIGMYAFLGCTNLTSITIPNSVTSIDIYTFYGCSGLTSVTIPNSVTSIGNYAFYECSRLSNVTSLNPTPPTCGTDVFYNVSVGNITLEVPSESVSLYQSADTWKDFGSIKGIESAEKSVLTFNKLNTTEVEVIAGTEKYTGDIVIPSKVLIDDNIYSVVSVANNAFQNCTGLTSIEISNNVKSIGNRAFSGCSSLVQAKIGDGVTSIGQHAFYDCKKMTDLTIGESVTSLESDAFNGCTNLSQITLPNSLECIKSYAFQNCYGLKDITIPDNVKTIEHYAFTSCSSLGCITLGKSVNSVGNLAFSNCKSLNNVISLNTTPPLCDGKPFASENLALKTLEVPSESVSLYQSADTWKDFGTIKAVSSSSRSESSGIEEMFADGDEVEYYTLQGVKVVNPSKGLYIRKQGNKVTKVVL